MIGSKRHPVHIVPDYTLFQGARALAIVEAKGPNESILRSEHVEQAYSYAIHPDVRCAHYALCNGRQLIVHHIHRWDPVAVIEVQSVDAHWGAVERALGPRYLDMPELREFAPDFGTALRKLGVPEGAQFPLDGYALQLLVRVDDRSFTVASTGEVVGADSLLTIDFDAMLLSAVLAGVPDPTRTLITDALSRFPYQVDLAAKVRISGVARVGAVTEGHFEPFVPLHLVKVSASEFVPNVSRTGDPRRLDDVPPNVLCL
jgi:hypothetical protein